MSFSYYYRGKLILCSTNFISSIPIFKTRRKIFRTIRFLVLTGPGPDLLGKFFNPWVQKYVDFLYIIQGPSWSYGIWIYNYLCNQCLSPLMLWVWILLRRGLLDTTFCDKVCQWLAAGRWFHPGTPVSSTNKTDRQDTIEILLKVSFWSSFEILLELLKTLLAINTDLLE